MSDGIGHEVSRRKRNYLGMQIEMTHGQGTIPESVDI
jgi:hypothetical protein